MLKTHNIVSVSGGKDSTATLLLAIERCTENLQAVFADTGHEHPETYKYLDYLEQATGIQIRRIKADFAARMEGKRRYILEHWAADGVPQERIDRAIECLQPTGNPFLDMCLWKGRFPSTKARFCTQELKVLPIQQQVYAPLLADPDTQDIYSWQGIRADESRARASLPEQDEDQMGVINYRPILRWTAEMVFDFHRKHGVRWNPLYEQGMGRVGCMPCVNSRKDELQEIARRFPAEIERVAEWERLASITAKRGNATFFCAVVDPTAAQSDDFTNAANTHGIARMVEWSKTSRGGRQYDMIASTATDTGCKSSYGLCETYSQSQEPPTC